MLVCIQFSDPPLFRPTIFPTSTHLAMSLLFLGESYTTTPVELSVWDRQFEQERCTLLVVVDVKGKGLREKWEVTFSDREGP